MAYSKCVAPVYGSHSRIIEHEIRLPFSVQLPSEFIGHWPGCVPMAPSCRGRRTFIRTVKVWRAVAVRTI